MKHHRLASTILSMLLLTCLPATAAEHDTLYRQTIHCTDASRKPLAEELATLLGRMTGKVFSIDDQADGAGIHLRVYSDDDGITALRDADAEAFLIRSDGKDELAIVGHTARGLQHGVYAYLEKLGVRWYLPTEHWTVIPSRDDITLTIDQVQAPIFAMREFSGTGGFGGSLPLDPNRQLQETWGAWQRHIRMDGRVAVSGHYGEMFNKKYRETLEANPDMLAEIDGKRQPWGEIVKLCNTNPKVIELYVKDRVDGYRELQEWYPGKPVSFAVTVEPADGLGHCTCAKCVALGSVSNRVFSLVNKTAKAVKAAFPDGKVSLFAYGAHALPPTFAVEDNVLVVVTPYAFQRTGLPPDKLLEAWSAKSKTIGIYDYWSIPDWSDDMPDFNLRQGMAKIRTWQNNNVIGALFESSYSSGAIGPLMYITSRVYWNENADAQAELDAYCNGAFGEAAAPMRNMIGRWFDDFLLSDQELALSYQDLLEAERLARSEVVNLRIDDYKRYVHYIRLWHEYLQSDEGARHDATDRLIEYCWRIYDSTMIHAYRMALLLTHRHEGADETHKQKWDTANGTIDWSTIKPVERVELNTLIADGVTKYQPQDYQRKRYGNDLVPLDPKIEPSDQWISTPTIGGSATFRLYASKPNQRITLRFTCGLMDNGSPTSAARIVAPGGSVVFDQLFATDKKTRDITFTAPTVGCYELTIFDQKSLYRIDVPTHLPFVITEGLMSGDLSGPMYFFVPRGLKRVAMYCPGVIDVDIRDSAGNIVPGDAQGSIILDVPKGQDGSVWSITRFKSWENLKLVNVPQALSFTREGLLVPRDAKP